MFSFRRFCEFCEEIILSKKLVDKRTAIERLAQSWKTVVFPDKDSNINYYPLIRLILPHLDTKRGSYNVKESVLGGYYVDAMCLDKSSREASLLIDYKGGKPGVRGSHRLKTFDELVQDLMRNRSSSPSKMISLDQINAALDRMAIGRTGVKDGLRDLITKLSPLEHKWLTRLLLRNLRLSTGDETVLASFYGPSACNLFNVNRDLESLCTELSELSSEEQIDCKLQLSKPFKFMLAWRSNEKLLNSIAIKGEFFMEIKYDGERVQIHKNGTSLKYYSRGYNEYGYIYGNSTEATQGSLARYLAQSFGDGVDTCILDGEMMTYDRRLQCLGSKAQNWDVKRIREDHPTHHPCFVVFDLLYLNGRLLTEVPLNERIAVMHQHLKPVPERIIISEQKSGTTVDEIMSYMENAMGNRQEGIMIKHATSTYVPNTRKGGWYKLKPDYMESVVTDLDCLIIGAYFGKGPNSKNITSFLLGVKEEEEFESFAVVASGLSSSEREVLASKLSPHLKVFDRRNPPEWLKLADGFKMCPDVYIEPKHSFVLQVKAAELMYSGVFACRTTMRFPRIVCPRYDKPWDQCLTLDELDAMYMEHKGKLTTKLPRGKRVRCFMFRVLGSEVIRDSSKIAKISDAFSNMEFCVMVSEEKAKLATDIFSMGGRCVLFPSSENCCVIAERLTFQVKQALKNNPNLDVIRLEWLNRCLHQKQLLPLVPLDYLYMSDTTSRRNEARFDLYGDSFTEPCNTQQLQQLFDKMAPTESVFKTDDEFRDAYKSFLNEHFFVDDAEWCRYRNDVRNKKDLNNKLDELKFRLYGGVVI